MRVLGSSEQLELLHLMASKAGLIGHAPNCATKNFMRIASEHFARGSDFQSTDIVGVIVILFFVPLRAREHDFISVQNDDEIARVCVTGVRHFVLTGDDFCERRCQAADDLILRIHDVPFRCVRTFGLEKMRNLLLRLISPRLKRNGFTGELTGACCL